MTDEQMMISIQNGNHLVFKLLVEKYLDQAVRVAVRFLNNKSIAEDVVQETFLKVWKKANLWNEKKAKFKIWFYRILKNSCIDILRKKREIFCEIENTIIDESQYSDSNLIEKERAKIIQQEISSLKNSYKVVLLLFYYEGFKVKEIAKILKKNQKATESLLLRAKQKLKQSLKDKI